MTPTFRRVIPAVLTPAECREAIAAAEARGFEAMGRRYPAGYRDNDRQLLDDPALAARLCERLRGAVPAAWDEAGWWELEGLNPRFRFCRYRDGQRFTVHRDGAWGAASDRRSWLTVMLYLNDAGGFEGGATRFFPAQGAPITDAIAPREGQAIVFDHRLWHDGAPVTKGTKYVMRTDVVYRRLRSAERAVPSAGPGLEVERVLTGHTGYVWSLARLADGSLVSGGRDGTVRGWNLKDGTSQVLRAVAGSVASLLEVEGRLWSGSREGRIDDGRRSWVAHDGAVLKLLRRSDGSVVSTGADGVVRRWSPTGEAEGELERHPGWVWSAAEHRGRLLAVSDPERAVASSGITSCVGGREGWLRLGDRTWQAHDGAATAVASLGAGRWASAGEDGAVRVWSEAGERLAEGRHLDFVRCLEPLGGGRFATGSYDETVVVWALSGSAPGAVS